ncbi:MAG: S9 family peptidase [Pseudomonadota bacterium]
MKRRNTWIPFTLLSLLFVTGNSWAETHPFAWDDLISMIRVSDPQPSPDGTRILFARGENNVEANKSNTDLGLISADGKTLQRLTVDPASDSNGRWLPDGSEILFLSARGGSSQIYRMSLSGGEPIKVTDLPVDIDGFELSPDGKTILFWSSVFVDCKDLDCTAKRIKEREESKVKAKIFESLFIRHWNEWNDGRPNHLFVMALDEKKPIDLMAGIDQDSPTKPFGGSEEIAWSPDGKQIAFTSKAAEGEAWKTNTDIYLVPSDGSAKPKSITTENLAFDTNPVFSPDGKTLAYLMMDRPGYEADQRRIVLYDLASGRKLDLARSWYRSVDQMVFSPDGKTVFVTAGEEGCGKIFSIELSSGNVRRLVSVGTNSTLRVLKNGSLLFLKERMTQPKEICRFNPTTSKETQISSVNGERLGQIRFGETEEFWFSNDGRKLHGWFVKPAGFQSGKSYPLAFLIHGGPQGSWEDSFHYRWNPEFYAGAGYAVVAIDFRGSTGYGQPFTDAIRGNWGPGPYSDLMAGLAEVLKRYPFIDKKRICALGASFGGYMVNWIAGQDHPFACLVNHDGDFDTVSSYYNTEELWFPEWDMTGPPWEKGEVYRKNSPMANVAKWKTPTLVIHGGKDFRVVETEGFSTFNVLQRRGIPSKLLYFPDEGHWVLKPQNSRLWHQTVLDWLNRWTATK